tara:strand:+ start:4744 stop:5340 length:597 start_codon:yes stop_codon:yes gene_type:complete
MTNIFNFLEQKNIAYAVLKGVHDEASCENETIGFKKDLDIVLDCNKEDVLPFLKADYNFKYLENNSFLAISDNLRIDLYFKTLNVGYYHFLKISPLSYKSKEVSEKEYIIYQILDPLLKFSKYQKRHQYRLTKYFSTGIPKDIEQCLSEVIGKKLASELLTNISNSQFDIRKKIIQKCKLRMLFINGNFVKMIKSRIF